MHGLLCAGIASIGHVVGQLYATDPRPAHALPYNVTTSGIDDAKVGVCRRVPEGVTNASGSWPDEKGSSCGEESNYQLNLHYLADA